MHLKPTKRTIEQTEMLAIIGEDILRRKIISEFLARILKLMSFIKLVLCNGSPWKNKSSLWKMQILINLATKFGCQGNVNVDVHSRQLDHFLCTDSSCATNFIPTKISYWKKRGRDLNSHLRDGFIVCTPRVTKILDCSLEK